MAPMLIAFGVFVLAAGFVFGAYYAFSKLPSMMMQRKIESRMADVFKSQPHWRRLIDSDGRGRYRLRVSQR